MYEVYCMLLLLGIFCCPPTQAGFLHSPKILKEVLNHAEKGDCKTGYYNMLPFMMKGL